MLNLKKRDCPIKLKLEPSGAMFLEVYLKINGDSHHFSPSCALGPQFSALLGALYAIHSESDPFESHDDHPQLFELEYSSDTNHIIHSISAKVSWDEEGNDVFITLSRNINENALDFSPTITLSILRGYNESDTKTYVVDTHDFCYAVAKGCTEVLKRFGFWGYRFSTEYDHFPIHQLLYIKALALNALESRKLTEVTDRGYGWMDVATSCFEDEMELLLFDM